WIFLSLGSNAHTFQLSHGCRFGFLAIHSQYVHGRKHEVVQYSQMRKEVELLKHHADMAPGFARSRALIHGLPLEEDSACIDHLNFIDASDQRRFTGTGWAADHDLLSLTHRE